MELLDRYLQAVGKHVPVERRDDIIEELRANLLEQAEDQEAELGRPLNLDEEEALFRKLGHPMVVAGRYLPQRYLIGPALFPIWWYTLKAAIPLAFLAYAALNALLFLTQPVTGSRIWGILERLPGVAVMVVVWVTVVFAVIEYAQAKYIKKGILCNWSPRKLPPVEPDPKYNRAHVIFEVTLSGLFLLWFLAIRHNPFLLWGPGAVLLKFMRPAPVWSTFYWVFFALLCAQWAIEFSGLFLTGLRRVRPVLGLVGKGAMIVVFALVLRANEYVVLTDAGRPVVGYQKLVETLNASLTIAFKVGILFFVLHLLWEIGNMVWRHSQGRSIVRNHA